jgi:hypothetical protein
MEELKFQCIECGAPTKYNNGKCNACYSKENGNSSKPSEGEEYIADFLKLFKIKFHEQKAIVGLINDTKKYRVADFYLPDYKVYIEYNGHYRDKREHYDEKTKVYKKNHVPCVNIYPENLGVLDYILDKRLQQEMIEKKLDGELKKYRYFKFLKGESEKMIVIGVLFGVMALVNWAEEKPFNGINIILMTIVLYHVYKVYKGYQNIFKYNKYPLSKLRE